MVGVNCFPLIHSKHNRGFCRPISELNRWAACLQIALVKSNDERKIFCVVFLKAANYEIIQIIVCQYSFSIKISFLRKKNLPQPKNCFYQSSHNLGKTLFFSSSFEKILLLAITINFLLFYNSTVFKFNLGLIFWFTNY